MTFNPSVLQIRSAKETVTEEIRLRIHRGDLQLGERISVDALAAAFGVSRTPIRDALIQLENEGLVTVRPRVGVFVREIGREEVLDVYRIKSVLEPLMVEWATERGSVAQRQRVYQETDLLDEAAEAADIVRYVELLERRRRQLTEMAQSDPLCDTMAILDGRVRLLRFRNLNQPGQLTRSARQHRVIADAIVRGDAAGAARAMRLHVDDAAERVRQLLGQESSDLATGSEPSGVATPGAPT